MKRRTYPIRGYCEHCDEDEQPVRRDDLRGTVCRHCDCAFDAFEKQELEEQVDSVD